MKISEQQILQLMTIAQGAMARSSAQGDDEFVSVVAKLISTINSQQSTELKEMNPS